MIDPGTEAWLDRNQRSLSETLAALRSEIERLADAAAKDQPANSVGVVAPLSANAVDLDGCESLSSLGAVFGLGSFEKRVLLLALGVELEPRFAEAVARASSGALGELPVGLALSLSSDASWSALCPQAPLRRWGLVELRGGGPLTRRQLKLDERILHHLLGVNYVDSRLDGLVGAVLPSAPLTGRQEQLLGPLTAAWSEADETPLPLLQLCGRDPSPARGLLTALCAEFGFKPLVLDLADIPSSFADRQALARLCDRELALSQGVLLIESIDSTTTPERVAAAVSLIDSMSGPTVVSSRDPLPIRHRPRLRFDVPEPNRSERAALWRATVGDRAPDLGATLEILASQFDLDSAGIRAAWATRASGVNGARLVPADELWESCRVQARRAIDALAERIESGATWEDLVLPPDQLTQLSDLTSHVGRAHQVYEQWGWSKKGNRGLGVAALFSGPSGTGKTLAAEVIANSLSLDLYRVDLAQVVSKYIGETEKNLAKIFDAAAEGGAILLFDEADALFGKRSEVKDSHDRYANVEVSYLLQRMEAYRGLAILTTNQKTALDTAFLRRLRFVVDFPFPDATRRVEIWERVFPSDTPLDGLDMRRLSRLSVSGGNIRSIAINAAFLAATEQQSVSMTHILTAARREYAKLDKPATTAEFGGAA
jgi:vesicle-fusing ATPase